MYINLVMYSEEGGWCPSLVHRGGLRSVDQNHDTGHRLQSGTPGEDVTDALNPRSLCHKSAIFIIQKGDRGRSNSFFQCKHQTATSLDDLSVRLSLYTADTFPLVTAVTPLNLIAAPLLLSPELSRRALDPELESSMQV